MATRYASNKRAIAECDRCGFQYKLRELREIILKRNNTNLKVCPECWEPSHPQLALGEFPVDDPQAIRDPRSDQAGYAQSRAQVIPIKGTRAFGMAGQVTVTT